MGGPVILMILLPWVTLGGICWAAYRWSLRRARRKSDLLRYQLEVAKEMHRW